MAHFYADIQGNRGGASRMGTSNSGITGHIRGWSVGARVFVSEVDGVDVVTVYATSGSNGRKADKIIAKFKANTYD